MSVVSCNRNFPFRGGSTTLGPSVDVWVPPAWPLVRARRVDFLFGPLNCKYVLEVPEKNVSTSDMVGTRFRSSRRCHCALGVIFLKGMLYFKTEMTRKRKSLTWPIEAPSKVSIVIGSSTLWSLPIDRCE